MITMSFGVLALMLGATASMSGLIGLLAGCCTRIAAERKPEKKEEKTCKR